MVTFWTLDGTGVSLRSTNTFYVASYLLATSVIIYCIANKPVHATPSTNHNQQSGRLPYRKFYARLGIRTFLSAYCVLDLLRSSDPKQHCNICLPWQPMVLVWCDATLRSLILTARWSVIAVLLAFFVVFEPPLLVMILKYHTLQSHIYAFVSTTVCFWTASRLPSRFGALICVVLDGHTPLWHSHKKT